MNRYEEILKRLEPYHQTHLLKFYQELSPEKQEMLLEDIESIDFEEMAKLFQNEKEQQQKAEDFQEKKEIVCDITPISVLDKSSLLPKEVEHYQKIGEDFIRAQKVAVCTMAGGQGSRLGHDGPKGTFIVPLKEPKSIFQIAAEHMLEAFKQYGVYLHWYIMTSEENDAVTQKFFEGHQYFGYAKEYIHFFKQGQLPLTDFEGNLLLQEKDKIFKAANGNGGIFKALEDHHILEELKQNKIEYLATCNVDNILIKPIDRLLLGILKEKNLELAIKSIIKRDPYEPVGVCCLKNGKPTVIEYIDLPKELAEARKEDGSLKFGEVHFGSNYLSTELLTRIVNEKLPYHSAKKKNRYRNKSGDYVEGNDVNSIKYEMFIFDGFEKANRAMVFRVKREEEFAPIKYKEGKDSPETAAKMYENYQIAHTTFVENHILQK